MSVVLIKDNQNAIFRLYLDAEGVQGIDFELTIAPLLQGEFSALLFSDSPMSPEHFLLVLQSGHRGVW